MNKYELKEKIHFNRTRLDDAISKISEDRRIMPILHGEWSVKDLIGHLGFWEERAVSLFSILKSGKEVEPDENTDEVNKEAIKNLSKKTYIELQKFEETAFNQVISLIENASEQELFDAGYFPVTGGSSFAEILSGDTWEHFDEHYSELLAWLKRVA